MGVVAKWFTLILSTTTPVYSSPDASMRGFRGVGIDLPIPAGFSFGRRSGLSWLAIHLHSQCAL